MSKFNNFKHSFKEGLALSAVAGGVGALFVAAIMVLVGGPVAIVTSLCSAVFGLIGASISALNAGTSGEGDYRGSWVGGAITASTVLALGLAAEAHHKPVQLKSPATIKHSFNQVLPPQSMTASIKPQITYPIVISMANHAA